MATWCELFGVMCVIVYGMCMSCCNMVICVYICVVNMVCWRMCVDMMVVVGDMAVYWGVLNMLEHYEFMTTTHDMCWTCDKVLVWFNHIVQM